jgi:hypothetical protein
MGTIAAGVGFAALQDCGIVHFLGRRAVFSIHRQHQYLLSRNLQTPGDELSFMIGRHAMR